MTTKVWGKREFWGIGSDFDPDWCYTEEEKSLRDKVIELCRTKIRPLAVKYDKTYEFPKESFDAMAKLGLMGLIVPKEFGGLGQSHTCLAMVLETLARYGCPSTAMIYAMHNQVTAILLLRYHNNEEIQNLLRRICSDGLIGSSAYSDPATGGHAWYSLTAKCKKIDEDHYKVFRFNSWTTSAGFADFYVLQTPSPDIESNYANATIFFVFKDEIRASSDDWSALGLHANQSGPVIFEGVLNKSRIIGTLGESEKINSETAFIFFYLTTTAAWNGVAFGSLDVAKRHSLCKTHGDNGMRVADYPIIQDYFGGCIAETNACRTQLLLITNQLDKLTNNNDWSLHKDMDFLPRSNLLLWFMQAKLNASENVSKVTDKMLKACGGDGYKTDLGLERLLRDAKAGCVMAPSNEVVKNTIGLTSLHGMQSLDLFGRCYNRKFLLNELNKMSLEDKEEFLNIITKDIENEVKESKRPGKSYQDTDFDNPFNVAPPKLREFHKTSDGAGHEPALKPNKWTLLKLQSKCKLNSTTWSFVFSFPNPSDHSGCLPGQYIQIRVKVGLREHTRYFSPVSATDQFGSIEIIIKYETNGIVSNVLEDLKEGESVEFRGPCGGFEYEPNILDEITILASGSGVTPAIQLIRTLALNPADTTKIKLIYYCKYEEEILCYDELRESSRDSRFNLIITLFEAPENWEGEEGFIDEKMIKKYATMNDSKKQRIILCGGPTMTISCLYSFRSLNFPSDLIFIYGQFGAEQIRTVFGRNAKLCNHTCDGESS